MPVHPHTPRPVLQGIQSGVANSRAGYWTERLCPAMPGAHKGDIITIAGGSQFGTPGEDGRRAPGGTVSRGDGIKHLPVSYTCRSFDREEVIPREYVSRTADILPIPIARTYLALATDFLLVGRDKRMAALIAATTLGYEDTPDAGDKWDVSTGKPIAQIKTGVSRIRAQGGNPNVIMMGRPDFDAFSINPNVLDTMSITADHALADEEWFTNAVARKLGLDRLIVADSLYDTSADPENRSLVYTFRGCFIGCQALMPQEQGALMPNGDIVLQPSCFVRVVEDEMEPDEYEVPNRRSRAVQVHHSEDIVAVTPELGAYLDTLTA